MSMGIGHFSVGVVGGFVLLRATRIHRRTTREGELAILSGLWAMIPDVGLVVPGVDSTDGTPLANVCWFHYYLDTHAFSESLTGNAVLIGLMPLAVGWLLLADYVGRSG
jgi:hypothetical protein